MGAYNFSISTWNIIVIYFLKVLAKCSLKIIIARGFSSHQQWVRKSLKMKGYERKETWR